MTKSERNDFLIDVNFPTVTMIYFIIAKRCLSLWIYGCLGRCQWNIVTSKKKKKKKKKKRKRGRYKSEEQKVIWAKKTYSVSDIQDYFEYILEKHGEKTDNPSITM